VNGFGRFCPFSALLFSHGARTVPSSRLDKDQNLLEILPDNFQKWYNKKRGSSSAPFFSIPLLLLPDGHLRHCPLEFTSGLPDEKGLVRLMNEIKVRAHLMLQPIKSAA